MSPKNGPLKLLFLTGRNLGPNPLKALSGATYRLDRSFFLRVREVFGEASSSGFRGDPK